MRNAWVFNFLTTPKTFLIFFKKVLNDKMKKINMLRI